MEQIAEKTLKLSGFLCGALLLAISPALASSSYIVTLNTTAINTTNGFVDFQLNPLGGGSQPVTATITGFTTNGTVTGPSGTLGATVTGTLPGTVAMASAPSFSEYFHGLTFGTTISFVVTLSGPGVDAPTGMAPGTTFLVSLYDSTNTNPLLTNSANGGIVAIDVTTAGTTTTTLYPDSMGGPSVGTATPATGPVITTQPTNLTVCEGGTATFSAAASGSPAPTVQWQVSTNGGGTWSNIAGATSTTFSIAGVAFSQNNNQYRAVFTNAVGTATTNAATLTVNTAPVITLNPVSQTITAGNSVTFTAAATGQPTPTVQWQVSTNGGATFTNIAGAISTSLTFVTAQTDNGKQYRAVFTNTCGMVNTTAATLTVQTPPVVTTQPTNQTVCAGSTATFTAAASGTPTPTVQWQVSTNGGGTFTNIAGATSTTLSIVTTAAMNNNQYHAVFTNGAGTATSNAATLTVNTAPVVTTNPVSQTVNAGNPVTFTAAASGQPTPTVQWQVSTNGGATFTDIAGATSLSLTFVTAAGDNGKQYHAAFTNTCGIANSTAATLTVQTAPQITLQPGNQTVCAGATATFMAAASGNPAPTVQWQVSVANGPFTNIPGATSTTLNITGTTAAMNGNRYQAVFNNVVGTATTNIVTLTVNTAPVVTLSPVNQTVNEGQPVTFTAAASGQPTPTVQWQVSVNGGPFTDIAGATNTTFSFIAAQALTKNRYRAVFTNTCGIAMTDPAIFINIPFDVFQIRYASNLTQGDAVVNISNTGVNGASLNGPGFGGAAGNICVNAYAFSPDEQLISCCSCLLTPNALASLSVTGDMISNTLTGVRPNSVVIKLIATGAGADFSGTNCTNSAALAGTTNFPLAPGMVALGTTLHPPAVTETPFLRGTLSLQELASINNRCTNIVGNGSTFGICRSCRVGGLNGAQ